jgi:MEDS: MEthanogen/methylotroph, DcmR Sensory domain
MLEDVPHERTIAVDRLEPGDHAFLAFCDDDERWDILGVFAQHGFERDEKVLLLVDADHQPSSVAARVAGGTGAGRHAVQSGQLVVSNAPRFARGRFDAGRQVEGVRRRIDTSIADGFSGLRSASEMSLTLAPLDHLDQAVEFETALHHALFCGPLDQRFTALCYWDERLFGGTSAMAAVHAVHPVTLLPRVGAMHVVATADGVTITGDSDLANHAEFSAALRLLGDLQRTTLILDLTDLSFFDANSAAAVHRLAARLDPPQHLEVRCRGTHRRLLHLVGGRSPGQLSIIAQRL